MRITKEAAKIAAISMTKKKSKEIEVAQKELSEIGFVLAKSTIKKDVLECYEKFKGYFQACGRINVTGTGLNHEEISFSPSLPVNSGAWRFTKLVDDKTAHKLILMLDNLKILKSQKERLEKDIEVALIGLGTYAKVNAEFKEAVPFLPIKEKAELAINLVDIRKRIS